MDMAQMWKPGDTFTIEVNQGAREAVVLAVIGDKSLIEYTMPAGSTALQIVTWGAEQRGRSVSYAAVPTKWLRAIVEEGCEWDGNPQGRGRRGRITSAEAMLAERTGYKPPAPLPTTHQIGCACESCGSGRIMDEWDPRMGPK
jgi:hypothetical protein